MLSSKGSLGTCIPKGLATFLHCASRRTDNGHYGAHGLRAAMQFERVVKEERWRKIGRI